MKIVRLRCALAIILLMILLTACATGITGYRLNTPQGNTLTGLFDEIKTGGLGDRYIRAGLKALEDGDYIAAQGGFNAALKFDPTSTQLHFLNGLTYHLRAASGDTSQIEYAAIGYRLALQYDAANYWAAYQLGHINFGDQKYREAQDAFAYALLFAPEELIFLKALATASYYAQDLTTADSAIRKAYHLASSDPYVLRMAALVSAALTNFNKANDYLVRYQEAEYEGSNHGNDLTQRVADWQRFHASNTPMELEQLTAKVPANANTSVGSGTPSSSNSDADHTDAPSGGIIKEIPQMALVDVVIISSEEIISSSRGVNLLNGLSLVFKDSMLSYKNTLVKNANGKTEAEKFMYSPALNIVANYALSIFNETGDKNEILARPSLIAQGNKKSEFFTGQSLNIQIQGTVGNNGKLEQVNTGVKLEVTPTFKSEDTVQLLVLAERSFLEIIPKHLISQNLNQAINLTITKVTANVIMKFDETIVIGGLTEREDEETSSGVMGLQNIPGLQYFFRDHDTRKFTKAVIILLTPRRPRYAFTDGTLKTDQANPDYARMEQPNLDELKGRPNWNDSANNMNAVFWHLKDVQLFREFRSGDLRMEVWHEKNAVSDQIMRALRSLYMR